MKSQLALIVILILAVALSASAARHAKGRAVQQLTSEFKNGEYVWHPEMSPAGPVVIIVSLPGQRMYVYRNAVSIGVSTISSGKKSHATPTGIFTILQKTDFPSLMSRCASFACSGFSFRGRPKLTSLSLAASRPALQSIGIWC